MQEIYLYIEEKNNELTYEDGLQEIFSARCYVLNQIEAVKFQTMVGWVVVFTNSKEYGTQVYFLKETL